MDTNRRVFVTGVTVLAGCGFAGTEALSQQGITQSLPASAVMNSSGNDGWQSQGGVVGPWWSGSGTAATPPVGSGGFWFGLPGLGFGGSQGATRGMGAVAPSVTTTNGASGYLSSSRLTPFVTGVVPVVGRGASVTPVTTGFDRSLQGPLVSSIPTGPIASVSRAPSPAGMMQPSTLGARDRVKELIAVGDRSLLDASDGPVAAKAALVEYRSAARFAQDDADLEIRQAILYEALGKRRDADRAIERATRIDRRLAGTIDTVPTDSGGFLASPPRGVPVVAARGFVILEAIANVATPSDVAEPGSGRSPVVDWLSKSWGCRWGCTPATMMRSREDDGESRSSMRPSG